MTPWPQHARPPCPSPTPGVHPNPCPLSWWCHPTISSSVGSFSSCPQSLSASGSFPMSQLFASGGQSIGVSGSTSVLPMNPQDWYPLGWTGWICLQSKGLSRYLLTYIWIHIHRWICGQKYFQNYTHIWYSILNIFYCLHLLKENKLKLNRLLNIRIWSILACYGYHNKIPQTGWLTEQEYIFAEFWRQEVQGQGVSSFGFF